MWNKKGALELSITAIVVLIIAITLLGFAIFFIKSLFTKGTALFEEQFAQVQQQLREDFAARGASVGFNIGTEIKVKRGKDLNFYSGIRNTESKTPYTCYKVEIVCKQPFTTGNTCDGFTPPVVVGGEPVETLEVGPTWFTRMLSSVEVDPNDVYVSPITLFITTAQRDTYLMRLNLYKGVPGEECGVTSFEKFESIPFHIEVE